MKVTVLSSGRQDAGILHSTIAALQGAPAFECVYVQCVSNIGSELRRHEPDCLMLVGDRYETAYAALAATMACVPIVHLHGGEDSEGAFDNSLRNAITKLAHLHLVSHEKHADRVIAMGEDPATVHVVGAPGLDNMHRADLPTREQLEQRLGPLTAPVVLVTMHPATLGNSEVEAEAVVDAMHQVPATYVVTAPNADPGSDEVRAIMKQAPGIHVESLGSARYWGLLKIANAVLGNSSSAIIEAPSVGVPAVNVGVRQRGRLRAGNVIDASPVASEIAGALLFAMSEPFAPSTMFGDGHSADKIVSILKAWTPPKPPIKRGATR